MKNLKSLQKTDFGRLVDVLQEDGYSVAAPVEAGGVLAVRRIESVEEIARGYRDEQAPGRYRVEDVGDELYFGNAVGAESAKRFFFPAENDLFTARVDGDHFVLDRMADEPPRWALIGVRPCDLAAIRTQDRVFDAHDESGAVFRCESETYYTRAREEAFLVAVNCTAPGGNCFCASWGTGPEAREGFDLALTEVGGAFLLEPGSHRGEAVLDRLPVRDAEPSEIELAELKISRAREHMGKHLERDGLPELLGRNVEHRIWDWFAHHCMGCGNCTMVCPTCFCSTVTDSTDLATGAATRTRRWESCYTHQFSYVTSGPVRSATSARYRHWLTHKLGAWWEQFGSSGCVGCGRCLTWCPVGIDWTNEVAQLQTEDAARQAHEASTLEEVTR